MHPWGKFWRLLGRLGADSGYIKAQQDDPEVAHHLASQEKDDDPAWKPQPSDWSLLHELLARNGDRLGEVAALLADLPVGVKKRHTPPAAFPRPETELDKARKRVKSERDAKYDEEILAFADAAKARWRAQQAAAGEELAAALDDDQPPG